MLNSYPVHPPDTQKAKGKPFLRLAAGKAASVFEFDSEAERERAVMVGCWPPALCSIVKQAGELGVTAACHTNFEAITHNLKKLLDTIRLCTNILYSM